MALEGSDNCKLLVSPFPTPVPKALAVQGKAQERRVQLIESRKPNSLTILEEVRRILEERGVPCEAIDKKKHPVGGEESARTTSWAKFRGLLVLGVFD